MGVGERYRQVLREIEQCCVAAGRDPDELRLIAVSKTVGMEAVREAAAAGCLDFGENRPDPLCEKAAGHPSANWHFIGNIQSRRIPDIVSAASLVHSLHRIEHARKMDAAAAAIGKVQDVLLEVNVSGEQSKSGVAPEQALAFVRECACLGNVRLRGLMTMAPQGDAATARDCFMRLAELRGDIAREMPAERAKCFSELSMGMSGDWREAVHAGATMVRIGRAVFDGGFA